MKLFSLFAISDEQAMWRVQMQDDAEAFALLVERWETPIQNLCARMLGDLHRGEDIAQETFARLFAKRKEYEARAKVSTFLWRIALNLCYDELRRKNRNRETPFDGELSDDSGHASETLSPDVSLAREETAAHVRDALVQIPETYRSVLILRHYEDLKFREIAEVLDIPEGTVKSRMAEGLTQLARLLTQDVKASEKNGERDLRNEERRKELLVL
jgi:RNA polymerase sigma-70 factor, ECF subfamily